MTTEMLAVLAGAGGLAAAGLYVLVRRILRRRREKQMQPNVYPLW